MRITLLTAVFLALAACGAPVDDDKKKGGDHVPDGGTFEIAAVPDVLRGTGIAAREYKAEGLRQFLHVAERYQICMDPAEVPAADFAAIEARLKDQGEAVATRGLEGVVNYGLATLQKVKPQVARFSSRIAVDLVYTTMTSNCSFVVLRRPAAEFPFAQEKFAGKRAVFFNANQLKQRGAPERVNDLPVGYVDASLDQATTARAVQYLSAAYLGLGESPSESSYLNDNLVANATWKVEGLGPDAPILYAFALAYSDVLKPQDLSTFHYYADTLGYAAVATDTLLHVPVGSTPPKFQPVLGDARIDGVRLAYAPFAVCLSFDAATNPARADVGAALAFMSSATAGHLGAQLHAAEPAFDPKISIADAGAPCGLLVAFRDQTQYPFAGAAFNGLYAHEGRVKDGAGAVSPIPVIYINTSNLSLGAAPAGDNKWFGLVLEHETAHFMGLEHSSSTRSLLAPAGYNAAYDLDGGDRALFAAWAAAAVKMPH